MICEELEFGDLTVEVSCHKPCAQKFRVAPKYTQNLGDAVLDAMSGRYMNEARVYGVRSEAAMGLPASDHIWTIRQ